jgi:tetratricopeptide (TPR) repeat protein
MGKKTILNKLATLAFLGFISLNNLNAQENYHPKYHTIVHKVLQIEDSVKSSYPSLKTLDKLIDNSKKYIPKKENYTKEEIKKISQKFYSDMINEVPEIKNEIEICHKSSLILLAIGEANNIPFYITTVLGNINGHTYIIYDKNRDGHNPLNPNDKINKGDINISTTAGEIEDGEKYSDSYYIKQYHVSKKSLEEKINLSILNEKELLAITYWQIARDFYGIKEWDKAIKNCDKAIQLDTNSLPAYKIKGLILSQKKNPNKDYKQAIMNFDKALKLDSKPDLYYRKAYCLRNLKNYKESLQNYTTAINLIEENIRNEVHYESPYTNPNYEEFNSLHEFINSETDYLLGRSIAFYENGNVKESKEDFFKLNKLKELFSTDSYKSKKE